MTIDDLKSRGAIYVPNIIEGLKRYQNTTIRLNEQEALKTFQRLLLQNGPNHSFADFYYHRLDPQAKQTVSRFLTNEETAWLDCCDTNSDEIIFPLDQTLLSIIVKLNANEILFSTLYFTSEKSTWWGNYNQEYILLRC